MHAAPRAASVWLFNSRHCVAGCVTNTLPREKRIVKTDDFSSVFRLRPVRRTAHFVLYAKPRQLAQARLGMVIAKRFAPRAVTRNLIKRLSREIFRTSQLKPADCIVRLTAPVATKSQPASTSLLKSSLRQELLDLFSTQHLSGNA